MLEKLSPEQEKTLNKHKDEFVDLITNSYKYPHVDSLRESVNRIYGKAGLKAPTHIIVADSYVEEKVIVDYINDTEPVADKIRAYENTINEPLHKDLYSKTDEKVRSDVGRICTPCGIGEQWLQAKTVISNHFAADAKTLLPKIKNKIPNELVHPRRDRDHKIVEQNIGLQWSYWIARHMFFQRIGLVKSEEFENYYIKYILTNRVWSSQYFKDWCIITRMPLRIHRDERNRLHSTDAPALEWTDNTLNRHYFIRGIVFDQDMWEKVVTQKITTAELFKIQNMEQRQAVLSVISPEILLREMDAQLIDKHTPKKKKEWSRYSPEWKKLRPDDICLYKVQGEKVLPNMGQDIFILTYVDPSTQRKYFSFVEPSSATSAINAMAFKFGLSTKEYIDGMIIET